MFELRPYQTPIAGKVFKYIEDNPAKHPLVALPTGAGKTVVLAECIKEYLRRKPNGNVLVLSHVKEILQQNVEAIEDHLLFSVGVYSAGLDSKEIKQVTVASIQSAYSKPELFQDFKFVIIDECHLIPTDDNTMYKRFFAGLNSPNYFGLTATPFRLGSGYIYGEDDSIFDDVVYDLTSMENFNKLVEDGYLCKLMTKATSNEYDLDDIKTVAGDFDLKGMSRAFDRDNITNKCIKEIIKAGANYKKWLVFAIDIDHAEHIAEALIRSGVPTCVIHSKMDFDRDKVIQDFKNGVYKAAVNVNVLTTGFNDPEIDLIAMLRPTKSPIIHVQTIGRGLRTADGKDHCLILDFSGNTERLGPINDVHVYRKRKSTGDGEPITKRCPSCDYIHHPTVKICDNCGHVFKFKTNLNISSTSADVVATTKVNWFDVSNIKYYIHTKRNSPDSVRVQYSCGMRYFNEFVCIEHPGYAGYRAKHWARFRGTEADTAKELIEAEKKEPKKIKVDTRGKYPVIVDFEF